MRHALSISALLAILMAPATGTAAPVSHRPAHGNKPTAAKVSSLQAVQQPLPQQPQQFVQLRPSQMPAVAPRVSYQTGMLTVVAPNSTLADIIAAIRSATGVAIEGAPSGERVAAKIGPAPVRSVLLALFEGSRSDYVILGSVNDPQQVQRVILTPRSGGAAATSSSPAPPARVAEGSEVQADDSADQNDGFAAPEEMPQPIQQPTVPQQQIPPQSVPPQQQGANPYNPAMPPDQQVKTPEQLMEELRQMQQQQLQQQQPVPPNQNPSNPRRQ